MVYLNYHLLRTRQILDNNMSKAYGPMSEGSILLFPNLHDATGRPLPLSEAALRGKVCFGGKEYQVSLWEERMKKDASKIFFKGAIRSNLGMDLTTVSQTPWQSRTPDALAPLEVERGPVA